MSAKDFCSSMFVKKMSLKFNEGEVGDISEHSIILIVHWVMMINASQRLEFKLSNTMDDLAFCICSRCSHTALSFSKTRGIICALFESCSLTLTLLALYLHNHPLHMQYISIQYLFLCTICIVYNLQKYLTSISTLLLFLLYIFTQPIKSLESPVIFTCFLFPSIMAI